MRIGWIRGGLYPGIRSIIKILRQRGKGGPSLRVGPNTYAEMRKEDINLSLVERFTELSKSKIAATRILEIPEEDMSHGEILFDMGKPYSSRRFLSRRQGSRLEKFKKPGKAITAEFIKDPYSTCSHIRKTYADALQKIAMAAWGRFPRDWILERFMKVEEAVFLRDGEKEIGVMAVKKVNVDDRLIHYIEIALIDPAYRDLGLVRETTFLLVKDAFIEALDREYITKWGSRFKFINWLRSAPELAKAILFMFGWGKEPPPEIDNIKSTVAYLAVQPRVYGPWVAYENVEIHPDARDPQKKVLPEQLKVAEAIVPTGTKFDPDTFVLEGDYNGIEHLIPDPEGVLWHHDERVNVLFRERLRYEDQAGRDIVLVASFGIRFIREFIDKQRKKT